MSPNATMKMLPYLKLLAALSLLWSGSFVRGGDTLLFTPNATNQFKITGMSCNGCALGIASELKRVPGVLSAEVTFSNSLAIVVFDTNRVSAAGLKKTIVEAGYDAKLIKPPKTKRN